MQQNPRVGVPSIFDVDEDSFDEESHDVDVYLSQFYENLDLDSESMSDLSHSIANLVSTYHQQQLLNLVANSDVEYQIQSKNKLSQNIEDSADRKYVESHCWGCEIPSNLKS